MRWMTTLALVFVTGCDGGSDSDDDGCVEVAPTVRINVTDANGPITGADVEWDNVPCSEIGGGQYACTAPEGGANQLYVYAMNHLTYSQLQQGVPTPSCTAAVYEIDVELQQGIQ